MLNKRLRELRDFTQQRLFKKYRHDWTFDFVGEFKGKNLSLEKRAALAFKISCEALEPIVFPDEKISFVRTVNNVPAYYEPKEAKKALGVEKDAVLHPLNNLTINWEKLLNEGLSGRLELCREKLSKTKDKQKRDFLEAAVIVIVLYVGDLVRYRNPSHFQWMAEEIDEKLGKTPLYAVPGNHEILSVNGVVDRSLYNEVFGPGYYWFSYGEVLFVGLDSSTSAYDDEQLQWLDKTLAKIRPQFKYCVIFSHVPPVNVKVPNDHRLFDESRDRFAEVIRNRGVNLLISGHVHYYSESEFAGVPLITLPSSGQPIRSEIKKFGYVMFKADRDGIAKIKPVYVEAGDDMEHWEAFMSSALVDEDINFFSVWVFCAGVVLLFGGKILRL